MTILDDARDAFLKTPQIAGFSKKTVYKPRKFVSSQQQDITLNYGPLTRYIELTWVDTRLERPYITARYWETVNSEQRATYTEAGWSFSEH